tara:strand:- start:1256 stop:1387 length:132 start_codon:yes stop_codon:yes gene_type:complete
LGENGIFWGENGIFWGQKVGFLEHLEHFCPNLFKGFFCSNSIE